jgi:ATP-dependent helicase/nuclease subunit B
MALTAVISAASYHRIARGRDWLNARQPAEEVLIIGASPGAANELTRSLAREKRASFGYHHLTLGQLASALAQPLLNAQRTVPLGALGILAVANRAIHKLSQAGGLGRYVTITSGPGFARAIASVITEFRLGQIETDSLADVTPDLCPLLHAYKRELAEHGFTDWPGILHLAAGAAADPGCGHQLLGLPTLFLDVPLTTASDTALVRALCSRSSESLITVPALDAVTLARLRSGLGEEIVDLDLRAASEPGLKQERSGSLLRLQRHVFNDVVIAPQAKLDEQVAVFSAPGESRECVEIVRRVLALASEGIAFDRMAVLLRHRRNRRTWTKRNSSIAPNIPTAGVRHSVRDRLLTSLCLNFSKDFSVAHLAKTPSP